MEQSVKLGDNQLILYYKIFRLSFIFKKKREIKFINIH